MNSELNVEKECKTAKGFPCTGVQVDSKILHIRLLL